MRWETLIDAYFGFLKTVTGSFSNLLSSYSFNLAIKVVWCSERSGKGCGIFKKLHHFTFNIYLPLLT
ncbi:hypothetical protein [Daejeonella sp.]|uniref:hypothetical protein n=1 Tax=Daejeonella sp. TaxID=2805397 RepID=UPI0025BD0981|nr:hypothetical protein [Daejeonella sp.]